MARIQHNLMAANTHRQYTINNDNAASSAKKLSSGFRINSAADDAAGLAISEKMRAQIRGLNMASKNSQDGMSLIQTAEGALQEVHSMLQRMNELAVQSASETNDTGVDRAALQQEFSNLQKEIDQIASTTTFNDMRLLDGSLNDEASYAATVARPVKSSFSMVAAGSTAIDAMLDIDLDYAKLEKYLGKMATGADGGVFTAKISADGENLELSNEDGSINITATGLFTANGAGNAAVIAADSEPGSRTVTLSATIDGRQVDLGTATLAWTKEESGVEIELDETALTGEYEVNYSVEAASGLNIQVGAEEGQTMRISIDAMNTENLGVNASTIANSTDASKAITATRAAINQVSSQRADLGAFQNRLQHKVNNLDNTSENLQAAESRIRDVDMAKEMTEFTKNNILSQASTAMLAQANAAPQNVLQLLG